MQRMIFFKDFFKTSKLAILCVSHLVLHHFPLTVDAFEVQEIAAVVNLVELQAHLHIITRHRVPAAHSEMVGVHHLQRETCFQVLRLKVARRTFISLFFSKY